MPDSSANNVDAIKTKLMEYARGVDRRDWELVRNAYHVDAYDDHGGFKGGVDDLLVWLERRHATIAQSMHFLGNILIDFKSPVKAIAETYCLVFQKYGAEAFETIQSWLGDISLADGEYVEMRLTCRYIDEFKPRDGEWRIQRRQVVFESIACSKVEIPLGASWLQSTRDRSDPLWAAIAS
jgi:hypothetical protein